MESDHYGVCRLSVVAVRRDPADVSEQVSQLLFGDHYEVIDRSPDRKWLKIKIHFDQYVGWIDAKQHHSINKEYFEFINYAEFKVSLDLTSTLLYNKSPLVILIGSIIPISGAELFKMEEQFAFNGETKSLGQKRPFDFIRATAIKYLNAPYQWGGKSPFGIDCSGLTQMVFKLSGYRLFRDAWQQATQGKSIRTLSEALPGDIAFFKSKEGKIVHTGIILEQGKIIHASGKVRIDNLTQDGIIDELNVLTHTFSHCRRILSDQ